MTLIRVITAVLAVCLLPLVAAGADLTLRWTAPGDDGRIGQAAAFDLRVSTAPITAENWFQAVSVRDLPQPLPAGSAQSIVVPNLISGAVYFFAIRTVDEAGNWSPLSNVVSVLVGAQGCNGIAGNVDCDPDEIVNLADVSALMNHLFLEFGPLPCSGEANVNGDSSITITDLVFLIHYLFYDGPPPITCR